MSEKIWLPLSCCLLLLACDPADGDDDDSAPEEVSYDAIEPDDGERSKEAVDCAGSYSLPDEFLGDDGLGYHGWDVEDLTFKKAWPVYSRFESDWISDNTDEKASLRVRPWLVPEAGHCYRDRLALAAEEGADGGAPALGPTLSTISAFAHPWDGYDELEQDVYTVEDYDLDGGAVLVQALRGLMALDNDLPGAPDGDEWSDELRDELAAASADYPAALERALARLVLAIGEAHQLKVKALEDADADTVERIFDQFLAEYYGNSQTSYVSPAGGTVIDDMIAQAEEVKLTRFHAAGLAVGQAVDEVRGALVGAEPFDSPGIDLMTPHGRVLIRTGATDDTYEADDLEKAALVVDLAGDDRYGGRYAATHRFWMGASVLIDGAGDDLYTPETADIESSDTSAIEAFENDHGFTQGCGLFGVGVLADLGGNDVYTASVYAQGAGAFGVGVLFDQAGADRYQLGASGQGLGYFGTGVAFDADGDDRYGLFSVGQGTGKPEGHGLLLDLTGDDTYISYHNELEPNLPGPGYPNYFGLNWTWPYSDGEGRPHYMSISQGTGWGYRGDWLSDNVNWAGGFGALVDLGDGNDVHYGDCMTMGQGFIYGFGLLADGGGDDLYHTFWWGPAAAAHMGVGMMLEQDGDDEIHVSALSGGYGYDWSVGWVVDHGGDDRYGGQFNYGRAYTYGQTFFVNTGGDDVYNYDEAQTSPRFGVVDHGAMYTNLMGAFLDLGGGEDTYNTTIEGVANDTEWYLEAVGQNTDPDIHKGIGIDR